MTPQMTNKRTRSQSVSIKRMSEVNMCDNISHKCLGCLDQKPKKSSRANKNRKLDILPFTPVTSTSSSFVSLSSAKVPVLQKIGSKHQMHIKQPDPDSLLESNETTSHVTKREPSKSGIGSRRQIHIKQPDLDSLLESNRVPSNVTKKKRSKSEIGSRRQVHFKQPDPDLLLETNQATSLKTKIKQSKSEIGSRHQECVKEPNLLSLSESNQVPSHVTKRKRSKSEIGSRHQEHVKEPNPDSLLEFNQVTSHMTKEKRSKSIGNVGIEKIPQVITSDNRPAIENFNSKGNYIPRSKPVFMKRKSMPITNDSVDIKGIENYDREEKQNKKPKAEKEMKNPKQNQKSKKIPNHYLLETSTKKIGVPPFSPVAFPGTADQNSAEVQQDTKIRRHGAPLKQTNPDLLDSNQCKPQINKRTRSNYVGADKISEVNMRDNVSNQCLKSYGHKEKHIPSSKPVCMEMNEMIPKKNLCGDPKNLEVPNFSIKKFTRLYSLSGTENMSDDAFIKRHLKNEKLEIQRKRWDIQRIRELDRVAHLKRALNKRQSLNSDKDKPSTSLHSPANIEMIQMLNII